MSTLLLVDREKICRRKKCLKHLLSTVKHVLIYDSLENFQESLYWNIFFRFVTISPVTRMHEICMSLKSRLFLFTANSVYYLVFIASEIYSIFIFIYCNETKFPSFPYGEISLLSVLLLWKRKEFSSILNPLFVYMIV